MKSKVDPDFWLVWTWIGTHEEYNRL